MCWGKTYSSWWDLFGFGLQAGFMEQWTTPSRDWAGRQQQWRGAGHCGWCPHHFPTRYGTGSKHVLTPSLAQPVKYLGWNVHAYTPANSICDGSVISLLSVLHILIEIPPGAHAMGREKNLMVSNLALLLVVFWVMVQQAWHWKG